MSREPKFRIWNGYQFVTSTDIYIKACNGSLWDYDDGCLWSADAKIQQYTGLKDKNKVEIYEGDIIKLSTGETGSVKFENGSFYHDAKSDVCGQIYWNEVVGNIFENPELLKA